MEVAVQKIAVHMNVVKIATGRVSEGLHRQRRDVRSLHVEERNNLVCRDKREHLWLHLAFDVQSPQG